MTGLITTNSGESFAVNPSSAQWSYEYPSIYLGKGKGYMVNLKKFLDAPNEWFYSGGSLYLIPPTGSDPNAIAVEARVRDKGANLDGKRFVHLQGLHFKAANITMRNAEGCVVDDCSVRYPRTFFTFTNGFNRDEKDANKWSGAGVEISGFNNTMRNCYIAHSWGDGVSMWGENNTLENCLIEDCDWMAVDCAPLCVTGEGHLISHNTLRKGARSILVHRHLAGADILHNHMHDCGLMTDDLGLTYSFQTDSGGTVIAYNWVHDNNAPHTGPGIYLDNGNAIGGCDNGDYVMFTAFDFGQSFDLLTSRCAVPAEYAGQKMIVKIDQRNGAIIATLKVQNTGGWDNYQEQSTPMERVTGVHDLYFIFSGSYGVGNFDWFQFSRSPAAIAQQDKQVLTFHLAQNFPNPFNPATTIAYQLPSASRVTLQIFDIRGRLVETLVDRQQQAGHYSVQFANSQLPSGAYFYKLTAGDFSARRKMLLMH